MKIASRTKDAIDAVAQAAFLPYVLFDEDLARVFRIGPGAARRRLARGDFGPRFRSGRRWAVLRPSLLSHLESRSGYPSPPVTAKPKDVRPRPLGGGT